MSKKPSGGKPFLRVVGATDADDPLFADYGPVAGASKAPASRRQRESQFIGCPVAFMAAVCRRTEDRAALIVALCIYRRTMVCGTKTVTLPAADLTELGISRERKRTGLASLETARLIKVRNSTGRAAQITLAWKGD